MRNLFYSLSHHYQCALEQAGRTSNAGVHMYNFVCSRRRMKAKTVSRLSLWRLNTAAEMWS